MVWYSLWLRVSPADVQLPRYDSDSCLYQTERQHTLSTLCVCEYVRVFVCASVGVIVCEGEDSYVKATLYVCESVICEGV